MAQKVAGELYESITGQLFEIGRQLRQRNGYQFDPIVLQKFLQRGIEGRFADGKVAKVNHRPLVGDRTRALVPKIDPALDLETFFQTRAGLTIDDGFKRFVLQPALQADRTTFITPSRLSWRWLNKMSDDEDIEAELKRGYQFSELAAVFIIAGMIEMQSNGCDGLLHRGGRHLFYLSSCVLSIGSAWNEADEHDGWIIETNLRQNKRRTVGSRVFTRN